MTCKINWDWKPDPVETLILTRMRQKLEEMLREEDRKWEDMVINGDGKPQSLGVFHAKG